MADDETPKRRRKEPRWPPMPEDETTAERARRALNRIVYGVNTKKRIADD